MNTKTLIQLLPILLIIVAMYFLMIRPQSKKRKETESMRNNLRVGDNIITIGGIKGKITKILDEQTLEIEVGRNSNSSKLTVTRWAVSTADNSAPSSTASSSSNTEPEEKEKSSKPKRLNTDKE